MRNTCHGFKWAFLVFVLKHIWFCFGMWNRETLVWQTKCCGSWRVPVVFDWYPSLHKYRIGVATVRAQDIWWQWKWQVKGTLSSLFLYRYFFLLSSFPSTIVTVPNPALHVVISGPPAQFNCCFCVWTINKWHAEKVPHAALTCSFKDFCFVVLI